MACKRSSVRIRYPPHHNHKGFHRIETLFYFWIGKTWFKQFILTVRQGDS